MSSRKCNNCSLHWWNLLTEFVIQFHIHISAVHTFITIGRWILIRWQINILILISFLEKFSILYHKGTLQVVCPEASLPRNSGCATLEMFVFSCIGTLRWNAVCSFLPVLLRGTTVNLDLASAHRILSTIRSQAFGFGSWSQLICRQRLLLKFQFNIFVFV